MTLQAFGDAPLCQQSLASRALPCRHELQQVAWAIDVQTNPWQLEYNYLA